VEIVADDVVGKVRELKREQGLDIYLCGGSKLAGELLDEIDELVLKTYPGDQAAASLVGSTGYWDRQAFMPPWSASTCRKPSLRSCSAARALVCSRGQVQYRT
jgi:hypothetical protein